MINNSVEASLQCNILTFFLLKSPAIMPSAVRKLDVLIVGAGLGGLAAGLALQTDGHKVTIIDSAPEFAEVSLFFW